MLYVMISSEFYVFMFRQIVLTTYICTQSFLRYECYLCVSHIYVSQFFVDAFYWRLLESCDILSFSYLKFNC